MNTEEWEAVRTRIAALGRDPDATDIADALRWCGHVVSDSSVLAVSQALHRDSVGAGPLEPLLALPGVTDVIVNGPQEVYVDTGDGLRTVPVQFGSDEDVRRLAVRLAASVGRRLDDASPFVDARMADGTRVHAILGSLADAGTCLSLRVPARSRLTLDDWVASGTCHPEVADVLRRMVAAKVAFLVSGGTPNGRNPRMLLRGCLAQWCCRYGCVSVRRDAGRGEPLGPQELRGHLVLIADQVAHELAQAIGRLGGDVVIVLRVCPFVAQLVEAVRPAREAGVKGPALLHVLEGGLQVALLLGLVIPLVLHEQVQGRAEHDCCGAVGVDSQALHPFGVGGRDPLVDGGVERATAWRGPPMNALTSHVRHDQDPPTAPLALKHCGLQQVFRQSLAPLPRPRGERHSSEDRGEAAHTAAPRAGSASVRWGRE